MAGIYIHIPFCKARCIYCGFFSSTSLGLRNAYVDAVCRELSERKGYLLGEDVTTIYFGGGTPSLLSSEQIGRILHQIYNIYNVRANPEITLEGNPDDLTLDYLCSVRQLGVNRLSMGVQSFDDARLRFLHRRHSSSQAVLAIENAVQAGFDNVSIDLMYGFPGQTLCDWMDDVDKALQLPIQHISAYSLMYEEGTLLSNMLERGSIKELDEECSVKMYKGLVSMLEEAGFEHYEISNFCRPGFASRHNSSYWHGVPYLGVGAGAHSFDGQRRHYNVDSVTGYLSGASLCEETLTQTDKYNEFVFTGLRTQAGISLEELEQAFGTELLEYCMANSQKHIDSGMLVLSEDDNDIRILRLSEEGVFISNDIMSDLMFVD